MTYQSIMIRESRTDRWFSLDDIQGLNVLDEFERWLKGLPIEHFKDSAKKTYGKKPDVKRRNRIVMAKMRTGSYGTVGDEVVDTATHGTAYTTKELDAQTVETRSALLIPPGSTVALFFAEKQGHSGCGPLILPSFVGHLKSMVSGKISKTTGKPLSLVVDTETVVSPDSWLALAKLESVTATVYDYSPDIADDSSTTSTLMNYSSTLTPIKGERWLPSKIKDIVRGKKLEGVTDLGFPDDLNYDEMEMRLSDGERTKTMVVDKDRTPGIRVLLNDYGESSLGMSALIGMIDEEAKGFYERRSLDWKYEWTRKLPKPVTATR
ncbi:hypothetical protein [Arthrobacter sp. HY1533]|uniref:hypothetical protein n=1 Tax=Arthrobacter sp. HY1533 TaxID=2970919 RepID=UPI0022B9FAED|nr:hypothetical protein [Arthrobacter sp. HY1533]